MDEQILKDLVATANNPKYGGNWNIISSKFPELKQYDQQLLKDYVATANNPKYGGNWNTINSKFPEFGKKQPVKPKGVTTEQNTASQSASVNGGSLSASGDVRPKGYEGLTKKPKTFLEKAQEAEEEQRRRPKIGQEQKINIAEKIVEKKIPQKKVDTLGKKIDTKVKENYYSNTDINSRWTDVNQPDSNEVNNVLNNYPDVDTKGIDLMDFTRFLKNNTRYFEDKNIDNNNKTESEFVKNKYLQDYFKDRSNFLENKLKYTKPEDKNNYNKVVSELNSINNKYEDYVNTYLPEFVKLRDETILKQKENYSKIKNGDLSQYYNDIKNLSERFIKGGTNSILDIIYSGLDKVGAENLADKLRVDRNITEYKSNINTITNAKGRVVKYNNNEYIVTPSGEIIDSDTKTVINSFEDKNTIKQIYDLSKKSDEVKTLYSGRGYANSFSDVAGNLTSQILLTKGVSSVAAKAGLGTNLSLKVGEMTSVFGIVGASTYEQTLQELRDAGISDEIAKTEANKIAALTATASAVSSYFMPNANANKVTQGLNTKLLIKESIDVLKKDGKEGLADFLKTKASKIIYNSPDIIKEGGGEFLQEILEGKAQYVANQNANTEIGKQILQEGFKEGELLDTFILSATAGSLAASLGKAKEGAFGMDIKENFEYLSNIDINKIDKIGNNLVNSGDITQEEFTNLKNQVLNYRNNKSKLPSNIKGKKAVDATQLIAERENLKQQRKNLDEVFHPEIDAKIESINNQLKGVLSQPETTEDNTAQEQTIVERNEEEINSEESLKTTLDNGVWGMLTVENPEAKKLSEEENAVRNSEAKKWLEEKGYKPKEIKGKYGNEENSFFVPNLSKQDAIEFARTFNQESVATNEGLVYQDGSFNPRVEGVEVGGNYEDFYSTMKIGDKDVSFQVNYNFDEKINEPNQTTTTTEEVTVPNQEGKNTGNDEVLPTSITKENFEGLNLSETLGLNTLSNVLEDWDNKLKDFSKDTLGVNLPVVVARGAIKAMKAAVSVSKTGADVLSAGINYVRNTDWYKNLNDSDKKDFESKGILSYLTETENKKVAENVIKSETIDNKKSTKAIVRQNTGQTDTSPKVTTTESKLLKEKFKNLQRGFKEGVKETNQFKKEFITEVENSIKGLKGLISSETSRILKAVRDINPNNIVTVQNKIDRLVEIIENKEFYRDIKNVKSDVSKLSKSKSKPQNLTNIAKKAGKVNERYLSKKEASEYKDTLDKIKNGLLPVSNPNYKPFNVEEVLNTLERLNDSANTNQILQLAEDYGFADLGLSEKEIIDLINGENIDEYVDNLEEAKKKQILDNFRNIAKYSQIGLKEKVFQTEISDREKKQVKNLREVDLSNMSLQQLKDFTTVSDNITMNEDFSGAGKIDVVVSVKKAGNDIKGRNIPVNDITIDASSKWMLPSWANPAEWTSSFINHVTGINVFFVKMFGRKDGGFLYDKSKALDLSDANTIKTQKEKEFREAMSNKMDELSKKYPDIRDNKNNARRAVLAILLQAEQGNVSDMTRLKEKYIKKSIDNIAKSKNDAQSAKQMELIQNILTELENIKTKEELIDYLEKNDKGNFEVLKTARDFFAKNTQGLEEVANNYYNQKFDSRSYDDFYLPIMTKSTVPASLKKGDSDNVIGGNFGADVVNLVKTGSLESRKQYAGLRNDTIINLNFDDSAVGKYAEQVYTIEATPVVMYVKEFFNDPQIMSTIGIGNRIKLMELIGRKIDLDSGNRFGNLQAIDKNVMKIEKAVRQVGVTMGLGGITQAPKQFMTVMATTIRLGNKAYLLPKAMFSRGDAKEFLKIGSVSLRGDTIGATVRLGDNVNFKNMSLSEKSKISRLVENIARGASVTRQKAMEITMGALRFADTYAFESTYIAHYMERLIELGVPESEIDMKTEHLKLDDEVRREARAYALNMANVVQTSSDQSEHSKLATNQDAVGKIAMTIIMPFSGVPNNSMARMYGAMSRAASTKGASKEALNEVIATSLGEVLSFHAMKNFGIAYLTNALYQAFYGEEDDEEDNFNWAFQTVKTISGGFTDLIPYPEYLEAEALNWLAYKTQKKEMQENGIKVDNYDNFKNYIKYLPFKEASDDSYSPVYLYKYEEANNYDTGILSKAKDLGIYSIPIDQYQTASEVYEALFKGTVTRESRYSKVEYEIAPEHKNFIMTMALVETMTMIAATDADTRRFMEKRFREIVRESDKEYIKTPKNSSKSKPKKISDSTWGQY